MSYYPSVQNLSFKFLGIKLNRQLCVLYYVTYINVLIKDRYCNCTLIQVWVLHASGDADIVVFMRKRNNSRNSWSHYESVGVAEQFMTRYHDVYNLWVAYTKIADNGK